MLVDVGRLRPAGWRREWLLVGAIAALNLAAVLPLAFLGPERGLVYFGGLVAALVVVVLLVSRGAEAALWIMLGLLFFSNRVEFPQLEVLGRWLPTAGILFLLAAVVLGLGRQGGRPPPSFSRIWPVIAIVLLYVVWVTISWIGNASSPDKLGLGLAVYVRYYAFFILLLLANLGVGFYRRYLDVFVALTIVQVPVTLVQFLILDLKGDLVGGTLGHNSQLMVVVIVTAIILFARVLVERVTPGVAMLAVGMVVPLVIADIQASILFLAIAMLYMAARYGTSVDLLKVVRSLFVFGVVGAIFLAVAYAELPDAFEQLRQLERIEEAMGQEYMASSSVGRLTVIPFIFDTLLAQAPANLVYGFGPEASYGGVLGGAQGAACTFFVNRGLSECRTTQLFRHIGDYGVIGFLLCVMLHYAVWRLTWRPQRSILDPRSRIVLLSADGYGLLYVLLLPIYNDSWRLDVFPFAFFLLVAAAMAEVDRAEPTKVATTTVNRYN